MYLFFDTETNGLLRYNPLTQKTEYPRIAEIAWELFNENGELLVSESRLIKPDNWTIPTVEELIAQGSKKPHFFVNNNMSTERCEQHGVIIRHALDAMHDSMNKAKYLIAHNMEFDENVLSGECYRYGYKFGCSPVRVCTMKQQTIQSTKISLTDLYKSLFIEGFDGAHSALADVKACARAFFELKNTNRLKNFS